ncbi:HAD-IA family hydrolase [Vibrio nigripulchritudo]|uniref:HAD-IA family hydrolase n=1 Tax=Vibrio nigripulchritudo TaxID=28173 RepID=UPI0003B20859|nr:HAD-IA family hydrolase [Vibrio nigripulchritudo]CCN69379.1 putative Haloacid dehalogenase-like hydrolase fused with GCN5-related N-acetyltransferase [Vibrio nigripulchritudo SFn118]
MIKAVYFDLDNTLVDRNASIDKFSHEFVRHFSTQLKNPNVESIAATIKDIDNGGYLPADSKYDRIYKALGAELPAILEWRTTPSSEEIEQFWIDHIPECAVEMDGASDLISTLKSAGMYLGIISNGEEWSRQRTARATSFASSFDQIVSSEVAQSNKPDPKIFIETAKAAGFKPEECIYVGDHPINDIQGASEAGMHPIWLSGFHSHPSQALLFKSADHLSEVLDHCLATIKRCQIASIKMHFLADEPEHAKTIANWYFNEWSRLSPDLTEDKLFRSIQQNAHQKFELPLMMIAKLEQQLVGVTEIKLRENRDYPEYEHWLGGIYVHADFRGFGIASIMLENAKQHAKRLGIKTLYLQCESHNVGLYLRNGYQVLHSAKHHNVDTTILSTEVCDD